MTLWSIGHSTHALEELASLLGRHDVTEVADIRTVPRSRRNPQFESASLAGSLPAFGIAYRHVPALGGWRRPEPGSPNGAWQNPSFRGYADYALTPAFAAALDELLDRAATIRTAMMCSEALWWRCHRRIVADHLAARGETVWHIGPDGRLAEHRISPFAVVAPGGRVTYPPG